MPFDILIADSGSTKAEWAVLTANGTKKIVTQGISPYFLNTGQIILLLQEELLKNISDSNGIQEVYYYGTGCTAPNMTGIVYNALNVLFPRASIHVDYDLVAAAHALCGTQEGIACILGTGSNSCYYNGREIEMNSPGLGYILGDEGSGAYLGKRIITQYLYGKLNADVERQFEIRFDIDKNTLLENVYSTNLPNRYLASFSLFFAEHRGDPGLEIVLRAGLEDFFSVHIAGYPASKSVPVSFTGSIAWGYKDLILELCKKYNCQPGKIVREPMSDLVEYYRLKRDS
ncbi:MAG: N-acetylglucosamine kinase [Chitinophagaceae bacterium]|nr:N-acetylglucosamine kinase [Chitinophagaceae bacterium]